MAATDSGGCVRLPGTGFGLRSPVMRSVYDELGKFADHGRHCVLFGPSGVGKEYAAREYHRVFADKRGRDPQDVPFVSLNCSCLTATTGLVELFGSEPGIYTGAIKRDGLWVQAANGILFLDEIGDLPVEVQAQLLRALNGEYSEIRRMGGKVSKDVGNVTVLAATERDPGDLRPALLMRLGMQVTIPGVAERSGDIPPAVEHFVRRAIWKCRDGAGIISELTSLELKSLSDDLLDHPQVLRLAKAVARPLTPLVQAREWPFNFRAMGNAIDAAVICAERSEDPVEFTAEVARQFRGHAWRYCGESAPPPVDAGPAVESAPLSAPPVADDLARRIQDIIPETRSDAAEFARGLARFLHRQGTGRFRRHQLDSLRPSSPRTLQEDLAALVESGLLERVGKGRGTFYRVVEAVFTAATLPAFGNDVEFPLPKVTVPPFVARWVESVLAGQEQLQGLHISGEDPDERVRHAAALGWELLQSRPVLFAAFDEDISLEAVISRLEQRLFAEDLDGLLEAVNALDGDLLARVAFLAAHLSGFGDTEASPVLILDGLDRLTPEADRLLLAHMIRLAPRVLFIVTGPKMDNTFQAVTGRRMQEQRCGDGLGGGSD